MAVLIPALPLLSFLVLLFVGRRMHGSGPGVLATTAMAGSFVATAITFAGLVGREAESRSFTQELFTWIPALGVKAAILVDPLSMTMALFVTGVGTLIHLYAVAYMRGDPRYHLFFVYLNLFAASMLTLVLADNYLVMFVGWEGVGACSYLLISFWFTRDTAARAGTKAFVTNRVGDVGLLLAMFVLFRQFNSVAFAEVLGRVGELSTRTATVIVLLLLVGAAGKSAQLPLFAWLPDAMEGPTPVSALIHAATMVTAGVYLMARSSPLLEVAPDAMTVIAVLGVATAFFAATVACVQNDIKRVLAYSTISQLGFMFLAIGSGAYVAAVFHMVTHAFFKALLFLGAGSVIHGLHDDQDMKRMGGLRKLMPVTAATFIVGWLAIAGVPPLSGFWSKDEILAAAYAKSFPLWLAGAVTAGLTAYYMSRQVFLVFYGEARWSEARAGESGDDQHEGHGVEPHESPATMLTPLVVLAGLAAVGGLLNLPFTPRLEVLAHWLEPALAAGEHGHLEGGTKVVLAVVTTLISVGAIFAATVWLRRPEQPALEPAFLRQAWGIDAAYSQIVNGPGRLLASSSAAADRELVDGAVSGVATLVKRAGTSLRVVQTGYVRNYALAIILGTVVLLSWVVVRIGV